MSLSRRDFIRNLLVTPVIGSTLLNKSTIASAQSTANALGKTLVVIFQRGGCDGVNTVVPYGDADYYSVRGGSIAIPPPGEAARSTLDLDGFFGLHPSMSAMHDIYKTGDMAIMPAVSWVDTDRSHFKNQAAIESGGDFFSTQGWLNRHLQNQQREVPLRALNFGRFAQSMRGNYTVSSVSNLAERGLGESKNTRIQQFLEHTFPQQMSTVYELEHATGTSRDLLYKSGRKLLTDLDVLKDIDPSRYLVENNAIYPDSDLSDELKNAAQLIKANLGLEIISISDRGWDTHSGQGGAEEEGIHSKKLANFSDSIGAFYKDMGDNMEDVVILTMSEFGRSLKPNASNGTDHGHAAAWFVMGRSIAGGLFGEWPGLQSSQLNNGRYLAETIDFRNIMADILIRHLENPNIDQVIPDFTDHRPLGFFLNTVIQS